MPSLQKWSFVSLLTTCFCFLLHSTEKTETLIYLTSTIKIFIVIYLHQITDCITSCVSLDRCNPFRLPNVTSLSKNLFSSGKRLSMCFFCQKNTSQKTITLLHIGRIKAILLNRFMLHVRAGQSCMKYHMTLATTG